MPRKRTRAQRGTRPPKVTPIKRPRRATRWRAQVWDPLANEGQGAYVGVCKILNIRPAITFEDQQEAWAYIGRAQECLDRVGRGITVAQIRERWLARKRTRGGGILKESTQITNRERTQPLVNAYGDEPPYAIEAELMKFGRERMTAAQRETAKAMFNWAADQELIAASPLSRLRVEKGQGNRRVFPPREEQLGKLLSTARELGSALADWIEFGAWVGTRPGETDALQVGDFNADFSKVRILRQYNVKVKGFTVPKHQAEQWIAVAPRAQAIAMLHAAGKGPEEFVFTNLYGDHWTANSRPYHWNSLMMAAGFRRRVGTRTITTKKGERQVAVLESDFTPYLATRHYCGWYLVNVKGATEAEVAIQLRHDDGGALVRKLYGKRDAVMAIDRISDLLKADDEEALA